MLRTMLCGALLCALALLLSVQSSWAQTPWTSHRPDGHAPIGVMGDHTHSAGEFMVSYRFMAMAMAGNRDGTESLSDAEVVAPDGANFLIAPTEMPMQMHMLGLMYAPTDRITLMAMVPLVTMSMDHVTRMGGTFTTEAGGLGDLGLAALVVLARPERQRLHANLGVRLPTGSIEEQDVTPASAPNETTLPYPMQTGSGTFDLQPGLTYLGQTDRLSWGAQAMGTIRLGENSSDYRFGNVLDVTAWGGVNATDWLGGSLRLAASTWGDVSGANPAYAMGVTNRMVPTVFADLRAGTRFDLGLGANVLVPSGPLHHLRLAAEFELPVYQSLDGPQLETDWTLTLGAQYAF
ncbi:MAG: transporter [Bacteroidota bacterium]